MKTAFTKSFAKDLKKHAGEKKLLTSIQEIIQEVEAADSLTAINNLKKLKAEGSYFRIRSGNFRIGLTARPSPSFAYSIEAKSIDISHS